MVALDQSSSKFRFDVLNQMSRAQAI